MKFLFFLTRFLFFLNSFLLLEIDVDLENNEGNDQDFDAIKENDYDKDFEKFKKISGQEPEQVNLS